MPRLKAALPGLLVFLGALGAFAVNLSAADPCRSGLQPGQRPGPYAAVMATGDHRGQPFCYVCETGDRPAVIVFARRLSDPLGKLVAGLDKTLTKYKDADLRTWVTILANDQPGLDAKVVKWGQDHAVRRVPVGVFEDPDGPPAYRLAREADVTVLLVVKQRVEANFAFRPGELTDEAVAEVMEAIPRIAAKK